MWSSGMLTIKEIQNMKSFQEFSIALCEELKVAYDTIEMSKNSIERITRLLMKYVDDNSACAILNPNEISEILRQLVILRHDICEDKEAHILSKDFHEYC